MKEISALDRLNDARLAYITAWRNFFEHAPAHEFVCELIFLLDLQQSFMRPEREDEEE